MTRKIAILGATGSIGKSTLDLVERSPERFEVVAVTAATNVEALADIARRTGAKLAVVADERRLGELEELLAGTGCRAAAGEEALIEAAAGEADLVIAAIVGCAGLRPVMAAVEAGTHGRAGQQGSAGHRRRADDRRRARAAARLCCPSTASIMRFSNVLPAIATKMSQGSS